VVNFATASRKGEPFAQLNAKYKSLPNVRNRSCTGKLKIEVARKFIIDNNIKPADRENYIGIRYDEPMRYFKRKDEAKNALI
jgi:hypothetical protein